MRYPMECWVIVNTYHRSMVTMSTIEELDCWLSRIPKMPWGIPRIMESFHRASPWSLGPGFLASHPAVAVTLHPFRFGTWGVAYRCIWWVILQQVLSIADASITVYHIVVHRFLWVQGSPMYHESFNKIDTCSLRAKGSLHHVVSCCVKRRRALPQHFWPLPLVPL